VEGRGVRLVAAGAASGLPGHSWLQFDGAAAVGECGLWEGMAQPAVISS
jgi:hypothetical protein